MTAAEPVAGEPGGQVGSEPGAARLAAGLLDAEAERTRQAAAERDVLFADELLPGVGGQALTLREGLAAGGAATFVTLTLLSAFDELETATLGVLAPDIRDAFGMSDGAIVFLSSASGAFIVLGALPMGWLADRSRRGRVAGWAGLAFSAFVVACGLAANVFLMFLARLGVGVAKSSNLPVHGSLNADTYPIGVRGRLAAANAATGRIAATLSPLAVGGIAALAGGDDGWRWAFFVLGVPTALVALFAFRLPEPPRGRQEMRAVLGEVVAQDAPAPVSVEAAFARLMRIRTTRTVVLAFAALGFGLFTGPVLTNLWLEDHFGLGTFERGVYGTLGGAGVLLVLPFVGPYYDRLYRTDPARALRLVGLLILPVAVLIPVQWLMPNAPAFAVVQMLPLILLSAAFAMVGPVMQSVSPYRLRGLGAALAAVYIFFVGATGGSLLSALILDSYDPRVAALVIGVPSTLVGGLMLVRSSGFIKHDLSLVVAELREELAERDRQARDPEHVPVLQVHDVDFAYGNVQVLFGVGFEVRRGEVLALLGTNGAGKSTILKAVCGLGTPSRGVVRLNGKTITYVAPERRGRMGVRLLAGGKGVFPGMTVRENLEMAAFQLRDRDQAHRDGRLAYVLDVFPDLAARPGPLGLAPVVVQDLLAVVERLKADGLTMVVVEQSLNVALSIADRAVFLEKGQVRFTGDARELTERDDLARAVFLGRDGG
ncbi:ATP-binding protein [Yinghuangia seranimata]|uniref:ATP-binding protein n=1 Tax=Yinghuangia seranimata TaxID=408067 RepID=UPI00248CE0E9|nr:MFS transporter [Yinghuangia seranimata]MDI2127524.1 MFS transporter [Yinghuangia seranimata]